MLAKCVALLTMALLATLVTCAQDLSDSTHGMARAIVSPHGEHGEDTKPSLAEHEASASPSSKASEAKGSGKTDSRVQVFPGGVADCQTKPLPDAGQLYRAGYNKRERCFEEGSGSSAVTLCHECHTEPHGDDCWHGMSSHEGSVCNAGIFVGCCENGATDNCNPNADTCHQDPHSDRSWLKISSTGGSDGRGYKKFTNRAFVTSGGDTVSVIIQDINTTNGTLAFYMDGVEFPPQGSGGANIEHAWTNTSCPSSGTCSAKLAANSPHEFVVVFTPTDPYETSEAKIGMLYFEMAESETSCKETDPATFGCQETDSGGWNAGCSQTETSCFADLLDDDAIHLRTDNGALKDCFEEGQPCADETAQCMTACNQYKQCLEPVVNHVGSQSFEHLDFVTQMYLLTEPNRSYQADYTTSPSCVLNTTKDTATPACFSPATADLQDLACQCKQTFYNKCNDACGTDGVGLYGGVPQSECLMAIACHHPQVCASWKACYCNPVQGSAQHSCSESYSQSGSTFLQEETGLRKSIVMRRDTLGADSSARPKKLDSTNYGKCVTG